MKRAELISQMKQSVDGASFMNTTQFAKFMGRDRKAARKLITTAIKVEGTNLYFIPDLATDLLQR